MTDEDIFLSDREAEAWELTRNLSYEKAAREMDVTQNTLEGYLERAYRKRKRARATLEWMDAQE